MTVHNVDRDAPIVILPSSVDDFIEITGAKPEVSCRAWSVFYKSELAGIAGVTITRDASIMFSNIRDGKKYPATAIWKVACYVVSEALQMNKSIYAIGSDLSGPFLKRLGFYHIGRFNGLEYYQLWQK